MFGIRGERFGETVCAWTRCHCPVDVADLGAWCRGAISRHQIPSRFRLVDELPITVTGKIQKFAMRKAELAAVPARPVTRGT